MPGQTVVKIALPTGWETGFDKAKRELNVPSDWKAASVEMDGVRRIALRPASGGPIASYAQYAGWTVNPQRNYMLAAVGWEFLPDARTLWYKGGGGTVGFLVQGGHPTILERLARSSAKFAAVS